MKIAVIFTGGTIGSLNKNGAISPDSSSSELLLKSYREADAETEFVCSQPYTILSENLGAENLTDLYNCINSYNLDELDGIIVAHGTDTLQYTCAFLSYMFSSFPVPIIVISAAYPLGDSRTNGFENFSAAVSFIRARAGKGVFAVYKNSSDSFVAVHRGSRLLAHQAYSDSLYSIFNQSFGSVWEGRFVPNTVYSEITDGLTRDDFGFLKENSGVLFIKTYPGITYPTLEKSVKSVLFESCHSGTLGTSSKSLAEFCVLAEKLKIPVFLTGNPDGFNYESKAEFSRLGITVLPPSAPISMYMKLWLLKNPLDVTKACGGDFVG